MLLAGVVVEPATVGQTVTLLRAELLHRIEAPNRLHQVARLVAAGDLRALVSLQAQSASTQRFATSMIAQIGIELLLQRRSETLSPRTIGSLEVGVRSVEAQDSQPSSWLWNVTPSPPPTRTRQRSQGGVAKMNHTLELSY